MNDDGADSVTWLALAILILGPLDFLGSKLVTHPVLGVKLYLLDLPHHTGRSNLPGLQTQ